MYINKIEVLLISLLYNYDNELPKILNYWNIE